MSGTLWIVALWAIAIASAVLSFFVWSRLAHAPSRDDLVADGDEEEAGPQHDREHASEPDEGEPAHLGEAQELDSDQPVR